MQEKIIFREMLSELKSFADSKGNVLTQEEVKEFFAKADLKEEQLEFIYEYLNSQNIQVPGFVSKEKKETIPKEEPGEEAIEVPEPEEDHLSMYLEELEEILPLTEEEEETLYILAVQKEAQAKSRLIEHHLKTVCEVVREFVHRELSVSDLIQEGNIGLILAMDDMEEQNSLEAYRAYIKKEIRRSMEDALTMQQEQKKCGKEMIEKVSHLSQAVKNLEEELEHKVSLEELSAYLEMPTEEIKDILHIAGDEIELADGHTHSHED